VAVKTSKFMRDLDLLRDGHYAPIAYDDSRKDFPLTDPTFKLAPVALTRWILSWMPHVKVLAPRQLREQVRERMRQGLARCG
jgi:predicted DNA-binding transcriptional regulator YafY